MIAFGGEIYLFRVRSNSLSRLGKGASRLCPSAIIRWDRARRSLWHNRRAWVPAETSLPVLLPPILTVRTAAHARSIGPYASLKEPRPSLPGNQWTLATRYTLR